MSRAQLLPVAVFVDDRPSTVTVRTVPTPVPGLVVNEDPVAPGFWNVTHVASGAAVARLPEPEACLQAAIQLGEIADWTRSGGDLQADEEVTAAFSEWRDGPGRHHVPSDWKWWPGCVA